MKRKNFQDSSRFKKFSSKITNENFKRVSREFLGEIKIRKKIPIFYDLYLVHGNMKIYCYFLFKNNF